SQVGRLPDTSMGVEPLRMLFSAKGFYDKDIVALSAAHALSRSGWGVLSPEPRFDNSYFKSLLQRFVTERLQNSPEGRDASFREHVEAYAGDQGAFFQEPRGPAPGRRGPPPRASVRRGKNT
ncbi:unnamed protein product, partial [Prorocentrum cordatum]